MRGWSVNTSTDNNILRSSCVINSSIDIIGTCIAETHLLGRNILHLDGYTWFGYNRTNIHRNARTGSGGVGFFVKNEIFVDFNVSVLKESYEGILWLKLVHKTENSTLLPCVCYLPPENSSRRIDVNEFFDNLISDFYVFQSTGTPLICGDFNSRCGDLKDFIAGIDDIAPRNVIDFKTNYYGERLIEFLTNTNMCMLNGRFDQNFDNFTSVSVRGSSVVDYCIVTHDDLSMFHDFRGTSPVDLITAITDLRQAASSGVPDHALLSWKIATDFLQVQNYTDKKSFSTNFYDKFDLSKVPGSFMTSNECLNFVQMAIDCLEKKASKISRTLILFIVHGTILSGKTCILQFRIRGC